jgi:chorismate mutase
MAVDVLKTVEFDPFFANQGSKVHFVAGPCSAESEEQLLYTAQALKEAGVELFRAGIWKPRTRPNSFEGYGEAALPWLKSVKEATGMQIATEVANPLHLDLALKSGVDVVWIGARTVVNPFSVQAIADALRGMDIPVMVKNPINPDLKLWIGAIERIYGAGIRQIAAIHRGFTPYGESVYRNPPRWQVPIELRRIFPSLTFICDSSHITGNRHLLEKVSQQALDLGYEGIHLEVHPTPDAALSDPEQQITPEAFVAMAARLIPRHFSSTDAAFTENLENLRRQMDEVDDELMAMLAQRMKIARRIGSVKGQNNIALYQPERWNEVITRCMEKAEVYGLGAAFVSAYLDAVHQESLRQQAGEIEGAAFGESQP